MLRWAGRKTRLDHVRNVDIWKEAQMYPMAELLREKSLRWFGHLQRRDKDNATRKILQMMVSDGKRNRDRPKLRWRDLVKEDMARNQMTTEMAEDRKHWHVMIQAGTLRSVEVDRWEEGEMLMCVKWFSLNRLRLKQNFTQYPSIHTNYSLSNCTISNKTYFNRSSDFLVNN